MEVHQDCQRKQEEKHKGRVRVSIDWALDAWARTLERLSR
jgi:hypothetical protein